MNIDIQASPSLGTFLAIISLNKVLGLFFLCSGTPKMHGCFSYPTVHVGFLPSFFFFTVFSLFASY